MLADMTSMLKDTTGGLGLMDDVRVLHRVSFTGVLTLATAVLLHGYSCMRVKLGRRRVRVLNNGIIRGLVIHEISIKYRELQQVPNPINPLAVTNQSTVPL